MALPRETAAIVASAPVRAEEGLARSGATSSAAPAVLWVTPGQRGRIRQVLDNAPFEDARLIVVVDEFVAAVKARFPRALLQWEVFKKANPRVFPSFGRGVLSLDQL